MVTNTLDEFIGIIFANPVLLMALQAAFMIAFDVTFYVVPSDWYQCFLYLIASSALGLAYCSRVKTQTFMIAFGKHCTN